MRKRPMPADFPVNAATLSILRLSEIYGVDQFVIKRWHRENGGNPRAQRKPAPADFAEMASKMAQRALVVHYKVDKRTIARWTKETGAKPTSLYSRPPRFLRPADFVAIAQTMSQRSLADHYGVKRGVVARWVEETGVTPPRVAPDRKYTKPPKRAKPAALNITWDRGKAQHDDLRRIDQYDIAADVLRRQRFIVYRCGPTGKFLEKGLSWRVGSTVVTPDELLERAARYERAA